MKRLIAAFVAGLALTIGVGKAVAWTNDGTLNETASWLSGRPVYVQCDNARETLEDTVLTGLFSSAYAYVNFPDGAHPTDHMIVADYVCKPLLNWTRRHIRPKREADLAIAIMVITHEARHLHGEGDEAKAQCWAIRHVRYTALHLGLPDKEARWIRDIALRFDAQHNRDFPQYDLPGCQRPVAGS